MRITVQDGIDASGFQQLWYQAIAAGMECDARALRMRRAELEKLAPKSQASLFEDETEELRRR